MTRMELRRKARTLFPNWSIRMRAKWCLAAMRAPGPKVGMVREILTDPRHYHFGGSR